MFADLLQRPDQSRAVNGLVIEISHPKFGETNLEAGTAKRPNQLP
jgi:hypothetical protein